MAPYMWRHEERWNVLSDKSLSYFSFNEQHNMKLARWLIF